jgi:hypothetical protein
MLATYFPFHTLRRRDTNGCFSSRDCALKSWQVGKAARCVVEMLHPCQVLQADTGLIFRRATARNVLRQLRAIVWELAWQWRHELQAYHRDVRAFMFRLLLCHVRASRAVSCRTIHVSGLGASAQPLVRGRHWPLLREKVAALFEAMQLRGGGKHISKDVAACPHLTYTVPGVKPHTWLFRLWEDESNSN